MMHNFITAGRLLFVFLPLVCCDSSSAADAVLLDGTIGGAADVVEDGAAGAATRKMAGDDIVVPGAGDSEFEEPGEVTLGPTGEADSAWGYGSMQSSEAPGAQPQDADSPQDTELQGE